VKKRAFSRGNMKSGVLRCFKVFISVYKCCYDDVITLL
jgi:hypothetical protein